MVNARTLKSIDEKIWQKYNGHYTDRQYESELGKELKRRGVKKGGIAPKTYLNLENLNVHEMNRTLQMRGWYPKFNYADL
jgi:hypothetical protein